MMTRAELLLHAADVYEQLRAEAFGEAAEIVEAQETKTPRQRVLLEKCAAAIRARIRNDAP
jgi:hypothetical protein